MRIIMDSVSRWLLWLAVIQLVTPTTELGGLAHSNEPSMESQLRLQQQLNKISYFYSRTDGYDTSAEMPTNTASPTNKMPAIKATTTTTIILARRHLNGVDAQPDTVISSSLDSSSTAGAQVAETQSSSPRLEEEDVSNNNLLSTNTTNGSSATELSTGNAASAVGGLILELNAVQAADLGFWRHATSASVILAIAYTIVFVVGIIGNSFVIAIVYKSPRMRTVTNYFIANLAFADILVLLFCLPATLMANLFVPYVLGLFVCKTVSYLQGVAVSASINTMVAVTMDRFLAICFPMDWHMSRRMVRWTIACIWLFSLTISMPWAVYFTLVPVNYSDKNIYVCAEDWPSEKIGKYYFVCANLILCYLLPATVIILCYLGILYKIERRYIPGDRPKGLKIELIIQKSKLKVVKMMMIVVVIFLLSWLPLYLIFARIKLAEERSEWEEKLITWIMPLAQWLGASNSCINPILYTFFNRKYKRGFIDLLRFGFCCGPSAAASNGANQGATAGGATTNLKQVAIANAMQNNKHNRRAHGNGTAIKMDTFDYGGNNNSNLNNRNLANTMGHAHKNNFHSNNNESENDTTTNNNEDTTHSNVASSKQFSCSGKTVSAQSTTDTPFPAGLLRSSNSLNQPFELCSSSSSAIPFGGGTKKSVDRVLMALSSADDGVLEARPRRLSEVGTCRPNGGGASGKGASKASCLTGERRYSLLVAAGKSEVGVRRPLSALSGTGGRSRPLARGSTQVGRGGGTGGSGHDLGPFEEQFPEERQQQQRRQRNRTRRCPSRRQSDRDGRLRQELRKRHAVSSQQTSDELANLADGKLNRCSSNKLCQMSRSPLAVSSSSGRQRGKALADADVRPKRALSRSTGDRSLKSNSTNTTHDTVSTDITALSNGGTTSTTNQELTRGSYGSLNGHSPPRRQLTNAQQQRPETADQISALPVASDSGLQRQQRSSTSLSSQNYDEEEQPYDDDLVAEHEGYYDDDEKEYEEYDKEYSEEQQYDSDSDSQPDIELDGDEEKRVDTSDDDDNDNLLFGSTNDSQDEDDDDDDNNGGTRKLSSQPALDAPTNHVKGSLVPNGSSLMNVVIHKLNSCSSQKSGCQAARSELISLVPDAHGHQHTTSATSACDKLVVVDKVTRAANSSLYSKNFDNTDGSNHNHRRRVSLVGINFNSSSESTTTATYMQQQVSEFIDSAKEEPMPGTTENDLRGSHLEHGNLAHDRSNRGGFEQPGGTPDKKNVSGHVAQPEAHLPVQGPAPRQSGIVIRSNPIIHYKRTRERLNSTAQNACF